MPCIGDVEDAESVNVLITSSGLRNIRTGNSKIQVTTAEGNAQSEKRSLAGRQIALVIYNNLATMKPSWTFEIYQTSI